MMEKAADKCIYLEIHAYVPNNTLSCILQHYNVVIVALLGLQTS